MSISDRGADAAESIKSPATNLTLGSGFAAVIASAIVLFNKSFESIFGDDASKTIKASVLIAVIAAWALVAVADLISRAIAKAATERADAEKAMATATRAAGSIVIPMPKVLDAKKTAGTDEPGFKAAALRVKADGETSVLLVKKGEAADWVDRRDVDFV